jgi:hypothetical protein
MADYISDKRLTWKGIHDVFARVARKCQVCNKITNLFQAQKIKEHHQHNPFYFPRYLFSMDSHDIKNELVKSLAIKQELSKFLVIVDSGSNRVWAKATNNCTSDTALEFCKDLFDTSSTRPKHLRKDNGSQFGKHF